MQAVLSSLLVGEQRRGTSADDTASRKTDAFAGTKTATLSQLYGAEPRAGPWAEHLRRRERSGQKQSAGSDLSAGDEPQPAGGTRVRDDSARRGDGRRGCGGHSGA